MCALKNNSLSEYVDSRETAYLIIGLRKDGIMHLYMKPNVTLTLEGAKEAVSLVGEMGGGKAFPNLLDPQENSAIDQKARAYSKSDEANIYTIADAILVKNKAHQILGNVYINFKPPSKPTKMFTSRRNAEKWLRSFL